ncbi:MAG: hypothetical protein Q7V57_02940 [Actinomycetota bacterium]|nr:hypothetical protein [Actinomycetota bacterium]
MAALIAALDRHHVDYVLIGGMAARVYGASMPTQDLDILARDMPDNMERLAAALNELSARSDLATVATTDGLWGMNTSWDTAAGAVDVLVVAKGPTGGTVNWRAVDANAKTLRHGELSVRIASLEDLLIMKLAVGRPRDLAVAEQLVPGSTEAFRRGVGRTNTDRER